MKRELPPIVDALDLLATEMLMPDELVKGVLHRGSKLIIGGSSKSYKTWSLLDLALSIGAGVPWWGFETKPGRVLYVNLEIQEAFFRRRIDDVCAARQITLMSGLLSVWNLRGFATKAEEFGNAIIPQIGREFALVIVDPLYKLLGDRDENSATSMAQMLNVLERIAVESGAAVAFGSHYSKGNQAAKDSMDRISGSGVFGRDPDSIVTLTKHETDEAYTVEFALRNFQPVEPFVVRRQHPLMIRDDDLDPSKLKGPGAGRPTQYDPETLLGVLGNFELSSKEWFSLASENHGISRTAFYRILNQLQDRRKIFKSAISGKWVRKP